MQLQHQPTERISAISYCSLSNSARLWPSEDSSLATELWVMFATVSISIFDLLRSGDALSRIVARDNTPNVVSFPEYFPSGGKHFFCLFGFFKLRAASYFFTIALHCKHFSREKKQWKEIVGKGSAGRGKIPINLTRSVEKSALLDKCRKKSERVEF